MNFSFDPSTLPETLLITLKGMIGICVVTGVIMLAIWLLNRSSRPRKKEQ